jgi:hypothetical protein
VKPATLVIACGALARELLELQRRNHWSHVRITCLPAGLHNSPGDIPGAVRAAVERHRAEYAQVFVAYADCGTGGKLDRVLDQLGVERLPGAHCYEFLAGPDAFGALADEEPGTFYLTDFLARHFDRLVRRGLGLDRHPELRDQYFGSYRRVVLLAQSPSPGLTALAREQARFLGLDFVEHRTGLAPLQLVLQEGLAACRN